MNEKVCKKIRDAVFAQIKKIAPMLRMLKDSGSFYARQRYGKTDQEFGEILAKTEITLQNIIHLALTALSIVSMKKSLEKKLSKAMFFMSKQETAKKPEPSATAAAAAFQGKN